MWNAEVSFYKLKDICAKFIILKRIIGVLSLLHKNQSIINVLEKSVKNGLENFPCLSVKNVVLQADNQKLNDIFTKEKLIWYILWHAEMWIPLICKQENYVIWEIVLKN